MVHTVLPYMYTCIFTAGIFERTVQSEERGGASGPGGPSLLLCAYAHQPATDSSSHRARTAHVPETD